MDAVGHKVGALFVIIVAGVIGAIIPFIFKHNHLYTAMLLTKAFAAGCFLGLAFFHTWTEGTEMTEAAGFGFQLEGHLYNLGPLLVWAGFTLILFFEAVFKFPACCGCSEGDPFDAHGVGHDHDHDHGQAKNAAPIVSSEIELAPVAHAGTHSVDTMEAGMAEVKAPEKKVWFSAAAFSAMLALSLHALFEGMVIGLGHEASDVWMATAAVAGHKWAEGFALATAFIESTVIFNATMGYLCLFLIMSPLGIIIGMTAGAAGTLVEGIFNCLATGTILYVGTEIMFGVFHTPSEVHPETGKRKKRQSPYLRYLLFILGCGILFGLTVVHELSHDHDHDHDDDDDHDHDHRRMLAGFLAQKALEATAG